MNRMALDDLIRRLLEVRRCRPGKQVQQVQLGEGEIRQLCAASKDVFMRQPNLLELDAPIKIAGTPSPFTISNQFPATPPWSTSISCTLLLTKKEGKPGLRK
jgi:hypothetical protein